MLFSRRMAPHGKSYIEIPGQTSHSQYISRCDERFVGYGGNKAACLFEMYLSGVSFHVLADHFIIHQNHLYEETVRKNEVQIILQLALYF
jgi:hypothetical protein